MIELSTCASHREKLSSMMTDFVQDVKAGRHQEAGWPNTCYGMSKLGVIAYTKVRRDTVASWIAGVGPYEVYPTRSTDSVRRAVAKHSSAILSSVAVVPKIVRCGRRRSDDCVELECIPSFRAQARRACFCELSARDSLAER